MQIARSRNTLQKSFNLFQLSKKSLLFPSTRVYFSEQAAEDTKPAPAAKKEKEVDSTFTSIKRNPF